MKEKTLRTRGFAGRGRFSPSLSTFSCSHRSRGLSQRSPPPSTQILVLWGTPVPGSEGQWGVGGSHGGMSAWWPQVVEIERRGRVQDSELGDPKYGRAIWKLTGAPRPIFQGAGVSRPRHKGLGGTGISPQATELLGKSPEVLPVLWGCGDGVPSSSRRIERAGVGAGGERSRVTDTQPGCVVCCWGSVSVFLDIHLGMKPRGMQTKSHAFPPLKPPCHTCTAPPTPRPSVQAHY